MTRFLAAATDKRDLPEAFYSTGFVALLTISIISGLLFLFVPQIAASRPAASAKAGITRRS
jgi:competence protein ComGC